MPFNLFSAPRVEGSLRLLVNKRSLRPLCPHFHLEGGGRNEASGLINYIKTSPFMLMECEEADVPEMLYNISYFSEEKSDKLDDVWFVHVSPDEEDKILKPTARLSLPACRFDTGIGGLARLEKRPARLWSTTSPSAVGWERVIMTAVRLFYHHHFMAVYRQVTNALIITFLIQDFSWLPPPLMALALSPSLQLSPGQK